MSFILDALRKVEHERQRQAGPGIADIRAGTASRSSFPVWALALGGLLALNMIVVIVLAYRDHPTPEVTAPVNVAAPAPTTTAPPTRRRFRLPPRQPLQSPPPLRPRRRPSKQRNLRSQNPPLRPKLTPHCG